MSNTLVIGAGGFLPGGSWPDTWGAIVEGRVNAIRFPEGDLRAGYIGAPVGEIPATTVLKLSMKSQPNALARLTVYSLEQALQAAGLLGSDVLSIVPDRRLGVYVGSAMADPMTGRYPLN